METVAPIAVDEHLRVEALRAAAHSLDVGASAKDILARADKFEVWLLRDGK